MAKKNFTIRLSDKRLAKLRLYAQQKDKTMTQVLEECIDKLKLDTDGFNHHLAPLPAVKTDWLSLAR